MSVNAAHLRSCLAQFATGVCVITTEALDVAMTVNSFAALSLEPPLVLWSIRKSSSRLQAYLDASHFAVNILSRGQMDLASRFARSGAQERFEGVLRREAPSGAIILDGTCGWFDCRCAEVRDGGDHYILIGEVKAYEKREAVPLLFAQGRYAVPEDIVPLVKGGGQTLPNVAVGKPVLLLDLLHRASQTLSSEFEVYRRMESVDIFESRILGDLSRNVPSCIVDIAQRAFISIHEARTAASALISRGYLFKEADERLSLTHTGRKKWQLILEHATDFHTRKTVGISMTDLSTVRRVLFSLAGATVNNASGGDSIIADPMGSVVK